nr:unnamed protein product [Digitaria exilis]
MEKEAPPGIRRRRGGCAAHEPCCHHDSTGYHTGIAGGRVCHHGNTERVVINGFSADDELCRKYWGKSLCYVCQSRDWNR